MLLVCEWEQREQCNKHAVKCFPIASVKIFTLDSCLYRHCIILDTSDPIRFASPNYLRKCWRWTRRPGFPIGSSQTGGWAPCSTSSWTGAEKHGQRCNQGWREDCSDRFCLDSNTLYVCYYSMSLSSVKFCMFSNASEDISGFSSCLSPPKNMHAKQAMLQMSLGINNECVHVCVCVDNTSPVFFLDPGFLEATKHDLQASEI